MLTNTMSLFIFFFSFLVGKNDVNISRPPTFLSGNCSKELKPWKLSAARISSSCEQRDLIDTVGLYEVVHMLHVKE